MVALPPPSPSRCWGLGLGLGLGDVAELGGPTGDVPEGSSSACPQLAGGWLCARYHARQRCLLPEVCSKDRQQRRGWGSAAMPRGILGLLRPVSSSCGGTGHHWWDSGWILGTGTSSSVWQWVTARGAAPAWVRMSAGPALHRAPCRRWPQAGVQHWQRRRRRFSGQG